MDIVGEFIKTKGTEIINSLDRCGFSYEQATQFIPDAAKSVLDAISENDSATLLNSSENVRLYTLLGSINIIALASRIGIEANIAHNGLRKLIPAFLSFTKSSLGGFDELVHAINIKGDSLAQFINRRYG